MSGWWFQTCCYVRPYLGKWSNLANIFQMGWFNHHLVVRLAFLCLGVACGFQLSYSQPTQLGTSRGNSIFRNNLSPDRCKGQQNHSMVTDNFGEPHCCYRPRWWFVLNMFGIFTPKIPWGRFLPILTHLFQRGLVGSTTNKPVVVEDVFPIQDGDFPLLCLFTGGYCLPFMQIHYCQVFLTQLEALGFELTRRRRAGLWNDRAGHEDLPMLREVSHQTCLIFHHHGQSTYPYQK